MSEKYYQEYGPMRRRRGSTRPEPGSQPIEPVTELDLDEEPEPTRGSGRPPQTPRPTPPKRSALRLLLATLVGIGLILLVPYAMAFAVPFFTADQVPKGVSIQGQPIGGMTRSELQTQLEARYGPLRHSAITLVFEGQDWHPSLDDMGVKLDLDGTADQALLSGTTDPIGRLRALWQIWRGGYDIAPVMHIDGAILQKYLLSLSNDIEQSPRDASLSLTAGKVLPTQAHAGRQLLADETAIDIIQALQSLNPQEVAIRTRTLPARIDNNGAQAAIDEARKLLKSPLRLRQGSRDWVWDQERIASLLVVRADKGKLLVEVDKERLARQVEKLAQVVDSGSSEPRLAFQAGQVRIVSTGKVGLKLKQDEAAKAIIDSLHTELHVADLPIENVNPQVTEATLPKLGISELVAEGESSFAGSAPYRITNIKAGANRMDGVLIPPDAEFSFNTQLGEVDESNGFVKGYAVIGNRTQLEWGGGVCQVSTTVFRAAFWAGVPITERHAHPFYISWYDDFSFPDASSPGMDATIYTGVQDLKFVNDTGAWLLMSAKVDESAQTLTIQLYGTKPARTVQVVGPEISHIVPPPADPVYITDSTIPAGTVKQTDHARKGMDIAVYRVIEVGGVKKEPELFFTRFKSWPDVFVRGIGSP